MIATDLEFLISALSPLTLFPIPPYLELLISAFTPHSSTPLHSTGITQLPSFPVHFRTRLVR